MIEQVFRLWQPRFTVGVVGVLLDQTGERVFLVEHVFHTHKPWGLPGGWIDRREEPARTAEREFLEETGLRVRAIRPLIVRLGDRRRGHMDLVYLMAFENSEQSVQLSRELVSYRWTPCDALPPLADFHLAGIRAAREAVGIMSGTAQRQAPTPTT